MQNTSIISVVEQIANFGRALKAEELAHVLQIAPITVYKQAKQGRIPSFRIGTSVRFCPKAVADWLSRQ